MAPGYVQAAGLPSTPRELAQHRCIFIRESDETFGTWHLRAGARLETVKVRGALSSNDGETALTWALDGHGILMRSAWEVAPLLREGRLLPVLADWSLPPADVYVVFPTRSHLSAKTRALVDFLIEAFKPQRAEGSAW